LDKDINRLDNFPYILGMLPAIRLESLEAGRLQNLNDETDQADYHDAAKT